MTNLFISFLGTSISIGLVIALLILLTPFLNKRYAVKWKYWIWIALALRLIMPFGWHDIQPAVNMPSQTQLHTESGSEQVPSGTPSDETVPRQILVEIPAQMTSPIVMRPENPDSNISILDLIASVWMLGCLLFISVNLISYFYCKHQLLKKGKIVKDKAVLRLLLKLKHELHIKCTIHVIEYSEADSPMLTGFFNPVLVLPEEPYSPEELFFILKHELIHLKRKDIFFKLLFVTANAVHWFNPLIWIMQKQAAVDMELSCDERVTQNTDYAMRKAYTEALLSTLHKHNAKQTVLSTEFYGGKQIMKKRFQNILAKTGKKNGATVLICTILLTIGLGTLVGCSTAKENMENASAQPGTENLETKGIPIENIQIDKSLLESDGNFSEAELPLDDCSIIIGNISLSINENKRDILSKLKEAALNYSEFEPDKPAESKYDSYYNIDSWMQIYFLDNVCVRIRLIGAGFEDLDEAVQTVRGIRPGNTYSQMTTQYGNDFETHAYAGKEVYKIYRYSMDNCICEFGIPGENRESIYNVDLYAPSQYPIYDYGEELINETPMHSNGDPK